VFTELLLGNALIKFVAIFNYEGHILKTFAQRNTTAPFENSRLRTSTLITA
jgi:hypothetical protein